MEQTPGNHNSGNRGGGSGANHGGQTKKKKHYYYRPNQSKENRKDGQNRNRFPKKPTFETIDDIKRDILRVEKEIRLEIEEIKAMKI